MKTYQGYRLNRYKNGAYEAQGDNHGEWCTLAVFMSIDEAIRGLQTIVDANTIECSLDVSIVDGIVAISKNAKQSV